MNTTDKEQRSAWDDVVDAIVQTEVVPLMDGTGHTLNVEEAIRKALATAKEEAYRAGQREALEDILDWVRVFQENDPDNAAMNQIYSYIMFDRLKALARINK